MSELFLPPPPPSPRTHTHTPGIYISLRCHDICEFSPPWRKTYHHSLDKPPAVQILLDNFNYLSHLKCNLIFQLRLIRCHADVGFLCEVIKKVLLNSWNMCKEPNVSILIIPSFLFCVNRASVRVPYKV